MHEFEMTKMKWYVKKTSTVLYFKLCGSMNKNKIEIFTQLTFKSSSTVCTPAAILVANYTVTFQFPSKGGV